MNDNQGMTEFVAIAHPHVYLPTKRDALFFDRIGMVGFDVDPQGATSPAVTAELEWLAEQGVVFKTSLLVAPGDYPSEAVPYVEDGLTQIMVAAAAEFIARDVSNYSLLDSEAKIVERLQRFPPIIRNVDASAVARKAHLIFSQLLRRSPSEMRSVAEFATNQASQKAARLVAQLHRIVLGADAVPIGPGSPTDAALILGHVETPIVRLVIDQLPLPSDDTPWEKIINFRNDEDARLALRRLRRWMQTTSIEARSERELEDELQALLDSYSEYMRIHKMKTSRGTFQTVVTAVAEIAESVARFKFSRLANLLFAASSARITVLEAELKAPGREIAYIAKAKESFQK